MKHGDHILDYSTDRNGPLKANAGQGELLLRRIHGAQI
jgi:hypothetical protein